MGYKKTDFKDTLRDNSGNIIQRGTPLNAHVMGKIEDGIIEVEQKIDGEIGKVTTHLAQNIGEAPENAPTLWQEQQERGYNIKWFGAVGDGTTDDTEAFRKAFKWAIENSVTLIMPAGNYKITDKIDLGDNNKTTITFRLIGEGNNSIINFSGDHLFYLSDVNKHINYCDFRDISIRSAEATAVAFYAKCNSFAYNSFQNVTIRDCNCFDIYGNGWINKWTDCLFFSSPSVSFGMRFNQWSDDESPAGHTHNGYFSAMSITGTTLVTPAGYQVAVSPGVEFDNVNLERCVIELGYGFNFAGGTEAKRSIINFVGCYFDGVSQCFAAAYNITGPVTVNFSNCRFWQTDLTLSYLSLYSPYALYLNLDNNCFYGKPKDGEYYIQNYGDCHISAKGNIFEENGVAFSSTTGSELTNIKYIDGLDNLIIQNGVRYFKGTEPPTSGLYRVNDRLINTSVTPGSYQGWVCVTEGVPGVWKGYGSIDN